MIFLGIDPGMSGGMGILSSNNDMVYLAKAISFTNQTDKDISDYIKGIGNDAFCCLELAHAFKGQGISSTFKFGRNFGLLLGCLYTQNIPFELVSPQKWQKALGCLSSGDKNVTKAMAQRLFPQLKINHAVADSLLLAEYSKRVWCQRNGKIFR